VPAYVVAWLTVHDAEAMEPYRRDAPAILERYGGTYRAVGPGTEVLEGEWSADGLALLEFPTREAALRWYESAEYRPLRELRRGAADAVLLLTRDRPS
jgi:uncharacterized protein (DUF1330 family)